MLDDQDLLRSYNERGSEETFGHLVSRYVNLVDSAALRRVCGNVELAKDVAQILFSALETVESDDNFKSLEAAHSFRPPSNRPRSLESFRDD